MGPDLLKCWRVEAKILVVDDEDFLVEIIREKLELEGFQTEGAGNGVEALERLSTFNADLVISGIRMPVMEGVPLLRRCKEDFPDMPVILMTAGSSLTEQEAIKIGAAGFISKPFSWDDLLNLIKSVMT
jgi:DNA-binding NtrC family response regulator